MPKWFIICYYRIKVLACRKSLNSPFVRHWILPWWPQWPCASITRPDFLWFHAEHLRHLPLHRACSSLAHLDFWWISRSVLQHSSNLPCVSMTFCPSGRIYFASPVCSSPTAMSQPLPPGRSYRLIWCPISWLVGGCGARAVSRKTPIYFKNLFSPIKFPNVFRLDNFSNTIPSHEPI